MTSLLLGSLGAAGIAILFAMAYRRDAMMWRARSQHWFEVAMGVKPMIDDPERVLRDVFAVQRSELPPLSFPLDLVIGTPSCPVLLDRGGPLDDRAVASTLSDLVKGCGGRL